MKKLAIASAVFALGASVFAAETQEAEQTDAFHESVKEESKNFTPVQISLASPLSVTWGERDVYGLKANIFYGYSRNVYGLDLGLVGSNLGKFAGLQLNGFSVVDGDGCGVQFGALGNFVAKNFRGVQVGGLINWCRSEGVGSDDESELTAGVQLALFNFASGIYGVQLGAMNWNSYTAKGCDLGFVNVAQSDFSGLQLGAFNYTKGVFKGVQCGVFNMVFGMSDGLQLGLVNASDDHNGAQIGLLNLNTVAALPVMCIVNVNFR